MTKELDNKLTQRIQAWLSEPSGSRDIREGAEMLLRLNRSRILYVNILKRPEKMEAKLEYELKKYLRIRLDGLTRRDVVLMEHEVMPRAAETLASGLTEPGDGTPEISSDADYPTPVYAGRRADHDSLPEEVRKLWDENAGIFFRIKQTYNTLLGMEDATSCDRYEYLKQLDELDKRYHRNLERYDGYNPDTQEKKDPSGTVSIGASEVSAARKYISTNRNKLEKAIQDKDVSAVDRLRADMQSRVDTVIKAGENFKDDYRIKLEKLGLMFPSE